MKSFDGTLIPHGQVIKAWTEENFESLRTMKIFCTIHSATFGPPFDFGKICLVLPVEKLSQETISSIESDYKKLQGD